MNYEEFNLFRRGATRLIALHGGWNARSRRAVLWLAARHKIPPNEIASVLASSELNTGPAAQQWATLQGSANRASPRPAAQWVSQTARGDQLLKVVLVVSIVSFAISLAAAMIVLPSVIKSRSAQGGGARDPLAQPQPAPVVPESESREVVAGPPAPETDRPTSANDNQTTEPEPSSIQLQQPPGAILEQVERVFESTARRWPEMPEASRRAARQRLNEAITVLLNDTSTAEAALDLLERSLEPLVIETSVGSPGGGIEAAAIARGVWAAELLCGLDSRRRLPAWVTHRLSSMLWPLTGTTSASSTSCEAPAAALRAAARAIRTPADAPGGLADVRRASDAWARWLACALATTGSDQAARSSLMLSGLNILLKEAPEPIDSTTVTEAVRRLVAALGWRESSPERAWLLRVLVDPSHTPDDLFTLTAALAASSSAPGVDMTMVLAREAGESERQTLADRYADAWNMTSTIHLGSFVPIWAEASRQAISSFPSAPIDQLRHAARLSALTAAVSAAARGDEDAADTLLAQGRAEVQPLLEIVRSSPAYNPATDAQSGRWGIAFLGQERDHARRQALLLEFPAQADLIDARVLLDAIFKDSSSVVRLEAFHLARDNDHQPALLHAALDALPLMPRSATTSALIASLTLTPQISTTDPNWRHRLRLSLVERLYEMLGSEATGPLVDRAAESLASSFATRADRPQPRERADPMIEYVPLIEQWRVRVAALPGIDAAAALRPIDEKLSLRLGLATGSAQRLVAYQRAVAELLAVVTQTERPARREEIRSLLGETEERIDGSSHVFHQIAELEALCLRLWMIRLVGEEGPL